MLAEIVREPEHAMCSRSPRRSLGGRVDEADEIEPVLRVLEELAGDELADIARTDDQRVLEVRDALAGSVDRANARPMVTRAIASNQNTMSLQDVGSCESGQRRSGEEEPRA